MSLLSLLRMNRNNGQFILTIQILCNVNISQVSTYQQLVELNKYSLFRDTLQFYIYFASYWAVKDINYGKFDTSNSNEYCSMIF